MAAAETARLIASLELQGDKFTSGINQAVTGLNKIDSRLSKSTSFWKHSISTAFGVGLERAASAGIRGLFGALNAGIDSLQREGVVVAQTNAAIKSTGNAAGVTAVQIRDLSNALESKTAIDDKQVQAGANLLLTFTNIRNAAGQGNDIFTQSVSVLADLSTAMGTDMSSSAVQLGKALNDPVKGITALTRVGVTFDADQKKRIAQFVKEGKVAEAQKVILAELNKEFGGSGAAFAATDAGKAAKFQDAIEGIQQSIARGLLPAITRIRGALTNFLSDPATMGQIESLGNAIAGIFSEGNIKTAASLMTTAANAIGTAIKLFAGLPTEVQALAVGALALKKITGIGPTDILGAGKGAIELIFKSRGATPANPLFVSDVAGGLGKVAGAAAGIGAGTVAVAAVALAVPVLLAAAASGAFDSAATKAVEAARIRAGGLTNFGGKAGGQFGGTSSTAFNPLTGNLGRGAMPLSAVPRPTMAADQRQNLAEMAILRRALAKGFSPSQQAVTNTYNRDVLRAAEAQKEQTRRAAEASRATTQAVKDGDASIVAAIRGISLPQTIVNVTAANIQKVQTQRRRAVQSRTPRNSMVGANESG